MKGDLGQCWEQPDTETAEKVVADWYGTTQQIRHWSFGENGEYRCRTQIWHSELV